MNSQACAIKAVVDRQWNHDNVQARVKYNVNEPPIVPTKEDFWNQVARALLTTRQRSTPGSSVEIFASMEPFPLRLSAYEQMTDEQVANLISGKGLRFGPRISQFLRKNHNWLFTYGYGWTEIESILKPLAEQRFTPPNPSQKALERASAYKLADRLAGIGPKQSRNVLQELGLTRYEIPLDSRVTDWLIHNLDWNVGGTNLANHKHYDHVLDRIQTVCEAADVVPAIFDAAAFVEGAPSKPKNNTTNIGFVSANGQVVVRNTKVAGTDKNQFVYQLGCSHCGHVYGANGSDIFERKCPGCQGGKVGLAYD